MSDVFSGDARIIAETDDWAAVFKPHGMPSAPLSEGEGGTLLSWFLGERPEGNAVEGRKRVERGLLHRLDTDTAGLVLVAKTQPSYDTLLSAQGSGLFVKRYAAFSVAADATVWGFLSREPYRGFTLNGRIGQEGFPAFGIQSGFRPYGKGAKMVRPLFPGERGYEACRDHYATKVESLDKTDEPGVFRVVASLAKGYRHQIRAHLAAIGLPIAGDALYGAGAEPLANGYPLQLHAFSIAFPDPVTGSPVSVSLPLPDRMSR